VSRSAQDFLEFDKLRELLRLRSTSTLGRQAVDALQFRTDRAALETEFAHIGEAGEWLRRGRDLGFGGLADPSDWLAQIEGPGMALEAGELLHAASLLEIVGWLRVQFREDAQKFPLLAAQAGSVGDFHDLLATIKRCILPSRDLSDDASPTLRRIRNTIAQTRDALQKTLKQILRSRNAESGEDYVTLRNDRFVIPVRSENRRSVPGIVHGASGTGQTVFLEPFETVETNNQLVQLAEDESAEILRILRDLTERLQVRRGELITVADTISILDSVFARARFARDFDAVAPQFSQSSELRLQAARHPVLEDKLRRENRTVVPMSLSLGGSSSDPRLGADGSSSDPEIERVLVISGPNTGGKTVALKTVGLAALSGQSGVPVAAQIAVLPLFDAVLVDIGDEQSIAADLSTFSAHVLNLKAMLQAATPQSLVLADEMGTGTAPEEGAALAIALLDEFRAKNCIVLATTHHDRLKTYASTTPGVVNAAVEFDDVHLRPTFRLMVGVPGGSSGIAVARRLGLSEGIIERALSLLTPETREASDLISYLHRSRDELDRLRQQMITERRELEEERTKLREEWVSRQRNRIKQLEGQFAEMQKRFDENVASVIEAVKERELRASLEKSARRKFQDVRGGAREEFNTALVQTLADSQSDLGIRPSTDRAIPVGSLQPGARVRVRGFSKPVVLRRLEGSSAEIEAGPLRMKVAVDEITGVEGTLPDSDSSANMSRRNITVTSQPRETGAADEINVIGATVEEAAARVDKFLDEAALANLGKVRIIHGHGTGALRKGLGRFLASHPLVHAVSSETEERGGKAITVVELRG